MQDVLFLEQVPLFHRMCLIFETRSKQQKEEGMNRSGWLWGEGRVGGRGGGRRCLSFVTSAMRM